MKLKRQTIKRSCDDDYDDDWLPWFEVGASFILEETEPTRLRSMSPSAFRAIHHRPARPIGFHKP